MALIFSLSAECGPQKEAAEEVAKHFYGLTITSADGSQFPCGASTFYDGEGWWAVVVPDGVSQSGVGNESDRQNMTEISFVLYNRLRTAPAYRYALVGMEVDEFRYFREIDNDLVTLDFDGLVIADTVWQYLGSPDIYIPFVPGYHWRPFIKIY